MKVTFTMAEFDVLRKFQNSMAKQLACDPYVDADCVVMRVDFCKELKEMLRPLPKCNQFEFELKKLKCEDCPSEVVLLAAPTSTYVCEKCGEKRAKKKKNDPNTNQTT